MDAAAEVYAERGWTGFNFDVVARRAKVSKDAIYRRYDDTVGLLLASWSGVNRVETHHFESEAMAAGVGIRDYLLAVAKDHFAAYSGEYGFDHLRVYVEAKHHPEVLGAFLSERSFSNIARIRRTVNDAMASGVLPDAPSATVILDAIIGGVAMHVMVTPPDLRARMIERSPKYISELVDMVLRGAGYDPDRTQET